MQKKTKIRVIERSSTTIPRGSRAKWFEMASTLTSKVEGKDIVWSCMKV